MTTRAKPTLLASLMLAGLWSLSSQASAACAAWDKATAYTQGTVVSYNGAYYQSKWWTQNEVPGASQWGPWAASTKAACDAVPGGGTGGGGGGTGGGTGTLPPLPEPKPTVGAHSGSYFTQWGIYGRNYRLRTLVDRGGDKKLTFLNYAFGNVYADGKCGIVTRTETGNGDGGDGYADYQKSFAAAESVDGVADKWDDKLRGNFGQLRKLKLRNPDLKLLISLGGWTWSKNFSKAASTDAGRKTLVSSCIDLYIKGNLPTGENAGGPGVLATVFDGIDIDWEYPVSGGLPTNGYSAADKQNFSLLMAEFRAQLDALGTANKRKYYLTAAVGAGVDKIRNTEVAVYAKSLDWVNVMTYDFNGAWNATGPTNFQSHLYRDPAAPATGDAQFYTVNDAVQTMVQAGMPRAKINVGIPFYGRGWKGVKPGAANNGLYQAATGAGAGTYEAGIEDYKVLKTRTAAKVYYHPVTMQLWTYDGNEFWSYDDPTVIRTKIKYVKDQQLGGLFSWSLDGDDAQNTLLNAQWEVRGATPVVKSAK